MDRVTFGMTGIEVNKNGFGALPIQRVTKKEAVYLLQKAFYNGINYFRKLRLRQEVICEKIWRRASENFRRIT